MTFFEQLTGTKQKHSLALSETSSVGEDFSAWSDFGDELHVDDNDQVNANVGMAAAAAETVSIQIGKMVIN